MNIVSEIQAYNNACKETEKRGERICAILEKALKPVIPDIHCQLGWEEAGVDTICLFSDSHCAIEMEITDLCKIDLADIIKKVFPHLQVDTPYGVYVPRGKEQEIIKRLEALKRAG